MNVKHDNDINSHPHRSVGWIFDRDRYLIGREILTRTHRSIEVCRRCCWPPFPASNGDASCTDKSFPRPPAWCSISSAPRSRACGISHLRRGEKSRRVYFVRQLRSSWELASTFISVINSELKFNSIIQLPRFSSSNSQGTIITTIMIIIPAFPPFQPRVRSTSNPTTKLWSPIIDRLAPIDKCINRSGFALLANTFRATPLSNFLIINQVSLTFHAVKSLPRFAHVWRSPIMSSRKTYVFSFFAFLFESRVHEFPPSRNRMEEGGLSRETRLEIERYRNLGDTWRWPASNPNLQVTSQGGDTRKTGFSIFLPQTFHENHLHFHSVIQFLSPSNSILE